MTRKEWLREWQRDRYEYYKPIYDEWIKLYPFTLENLDGEEWKPIPDYEELYHGSNFGRVKSFQRGKVTILKPTLCGQGYLRVGLHKNGKMKDCRIHVLVGNLFIPNPQNLPEVNHDDGWKFNCHVSNLYWSTSAENTEHALRTGLRKSGEDCSFAKFTNEQVLYIRENPEGLTCVQLAEKFNVSFRQISDIQLGKKWKRVGGKIRQGKTQKYTPRIPDEIRAKIRAAHNPNVRGCGLSALAKRFGYGKTTIRRIVNEQSAE